jgi:hypothetical protein
MYNVFVAILTFTTYFLESTHMILTNTQWRQLENLLHLADSKLTSPGMSTESMFQLDVSQNKISNTFQAC